MKIKYIGEDRENLKTGTTYEVLGVEDGWFRVRVGAEESKLVPPEQCETLMRDWSFHADDIFHE